MAEEQYIIQEENSDEDLSVAAEEVPEALDPNTIMPPIFEGLFFDASEASSLR